MVCCSCIIGCHCFASSVLAVHDSGLFKWQTCSSIFFLATVLNSSPISEHWNHGFRSELLVVPRSQSHLEMWVSERREKVRGGRRTWKRKWEVKSKLARNAEHANILQTRCQAWKTLWMAVYFSARLFKTLAREILHLLSFFIFFIMSFALRSASRLQMCIYFSLISLYITLHVTTMYIPFWVTFN